MDHTLLCMLKIKNLETMQNIEAISGKRYIAEIYILTFRSSVVFFAPPALTTKSSLSARKLKLCLLYSSYIQQWVFLNSINWPILLAGT
jgi:hypothetical protein